MPTSNNVDPQTYNRELAERLRCAANDLRDAVKQSLARIGESHDCLTRARKKAARVSFPIADTRE